MKNFKKVLALVVVFTMMISTVAFAGTFADVDDDATYASAIETLAALGYFQGDDKGNFNPDATITRAEFATIVCRVLGVADSATGKATFTDVAADHWATGYIAMANQLGIVAGYGDGKFGPEDAVEYDQAIKMLVCALGYEPMAASKGGWPTGYVAVASSIGLLDGVSGSKATRANVAVMTYNALDIPVMEQTGYGTDIKYEIMKKNDDHDKKTVLTAVGTYKVGGTVVANSKVAYDGETKDTGYISVNWDDNYDSPIKPFSKYEQADLQEFYVGDTNAEDFVGQAVIIYFNEYKSGKFQVLAIEKDEGSTNTLSINASDLDEDNFDYSADKPSTYYYKEGANKSTKISLESDYRVVYNNTLISEANSAATINAITSDSSAAIEFIDWDANEKYDIIKVLDYAHFVVDEVNETTGKVTTLDGIKIDFDIDNDDAKVTIKDENGNALELKDIVSGDVLAAIVSSNDTNVPVLSQSATRTALKSANYASLDVTVLKDAKVEGSVAEYTDDADDHYVTIGSTKYDIADSDKGDCYGIDKIDLQADGTFYVGITGDIIGFDGSVSSSDNYGFIMSAYTSSNKSEAPTMTILTKDGKQVTYSVASSVKYYNPVDGKYTKCDTKEAPSAALVTALADTTWKTVLPANATIRESLKAAFNDDLDEIAEINKDKAVQQRTIQYKLNSSNEVYEITPAYYTETTGTTDDYDLAFTKADDEEYKLSGTKLGSYYMNDDTVIFDLDFDTPSNSKVKDVSYFTDESKYTAYLYNKDTDNYYGAAVIMDSDSVYTDGDPIAIVYSKSTTLNAKDEDVTKVVAYKGGEKVTLVFDEDSTEKYSSGTDASDFAFGTVIMYNADSAGLVDKYSVIGNITDYTNSAKVFELNSSFKTGYAAEADYKKGEAFYLGYITYKAKNDKNIEITVTDQVSDSTTYEGKGFTIPVDSNQYAITGNKNNKTVYVGSYVYGNVDVYDDDADVAYYVLVRTYEDSVVDVISFDDEGQPADATYATNDLVKAPAAVVETPAAEATKDPEVATIKDQDFEF